MKLSIRGQIPISDGEPFISAINRYTLWRLVTQDSRDEQDNDLFLFECWVNTEADRASLFEDLKLLVTIYRGWIDWHQCTHDEVVRQPCSPAGRYPEEE